jgi:hypothetical protein
MWDAGVQNGVALVKPCSWRVKLDTPQNHPSKSFHVEILLYAVSSRDVLTWWVTGHTCIMLLRQVRHALLLLS